MKHCFGNQSNFIGVFYLWSQFHTYVDLLEAHGDIVMKSYGTERTETMLAQKLLVIHLAYELLETFRQKPIANAHLLNTVMEPWLSDEALEACIERHDVAAVLVRFDKETMLWCKDILATPSTDLPVSRFLLLTITQASKSIEALIAKL